MARTVELPRLKEFHPFILTGSEASILRREPWVEREVDFVRERPSGSGSAGQLLRPSALALALAGPAHVGRCREPEIGWIPIEITTDSPLLGPGDRPIRFPSISTKSGIWQIHSSSWPRPEFAPSRLSE